MTSTEHTHNRDAYTQWLWSLLEVCASSLAFWAGFFLILLALCTRRRHQWFVLGALWPPEAIAASRQQSSTGENR